ncbi:unnamed protein product [Aphanomyces euteiches]
MEPTPLPSSTPSSPLPEVLSPTSKLRKLVSPTSRHLRTPSSPIDKSSLPLRPSSPSLQRTSSIPRLNSKVLALARKFELKIETATSPGSSSAASTPRSTVAAPSPKQPADEDAPDPNEETIRALVRIRPRTFSSRDENEPATATTSVRSCVEPDPDTPNMVNFKHPTDKRQFAVDALLTEDATQEQVFEAVGRRVVDNAMDGYNGCIFAYGQTGSGKTHTMQGDMAEGSAERGVIPRILEYLFEKLRPNQTLAGFDMTCSYLEIYNEKIYDLLDSANAEPKTIREDANAGIFVSDLLEEPVGSPHDALRLLEDGGKNRTVGSTAMNRESSRSHSVFTIKLTQRLDEDGVDITRKSTLHLVDLAGSEKQSQTGAVGTRLKEATQINKSLSVLGNVITALVEVSGGTKRHVPYRDSKLTFLLRDALGGNSKTTLIATVSAEEKYANETYSTLQFMQRAKNIKSVASKNEDTRMVIKKLQAELVDLRTQLDEARAIIDQRSASNAAGQEEMERLRMEKEDASGKTSALLAHVRLLEERLQQNDSAKDNRLKDQAAELASVHAELDECQNMLHQIQQEFKRARQAHTNEMAALRDELTRRDASATTWSQTQAALETKLEAATKQIETERREAESLKEVIAQLRKQTTQPRPAFVVEETKPVDRCGSIAEDGQPVEVLTPSKTASISRRLHRKSESDLTEEFRQAIGAFSIPSSIEDAHRDLQLQHDQLLHVIQKLDGLRNSKKFLQHALQTTLQDNTEMVQSLRKLQLERNTAMEALQRTLSETKKSEKHTTKSKSDDWGANITVAPLKRTSTATFSGYSTMQKDEELKQLAADKVTLISRLKTTQAKVQSLEEELEKIRLNQPVAELNAWEHEYGRVTRALLVATTVCDDGDPAKSAWKDLESKPLELNHTSIYEGVVETLVAKVKKLTTTVDDQKLTIQLLEKELHCHQLAKQLK